MRMNNDSSDAPPNGDEVMAVMQVEQNGDVSEGDTVKDATPQWLRRFPMCIQRILYFAFCFLVGLVALFLLAPYALFYHLWDADILRQTYLIDYQQDGTEVEAVVTDQHRETIQIVHITKDGYLVTVEYQEQQESLEEEEQVKWRKKFRFRTLEEVETMVTEADEEEGGRPYRTMSLCYPPGQPEAALPVTSVAKSAEYLGSSPPTNRLWTCLKDTAMIFGLHLYFLLVGSGFNFDFMATALFWIVVLVWSSASVSLVAMLYFCCGYSPVKLQQKLVCKSAERVGDDEAWEDEPRDGNNSNTSLTAPFLSAVTGF